MHCCAQCWHETKPTVQLIRSEKRTAKEGGRRGGRSERIRSIRSSRYGAIWKWRAAQGAERKRAFRCGRSLGAHLQGCLPMRLNTRRSKGSSALKGQEIVEASDPY